MKLVVEVTEVKDEPSGAVFTIALTVKDGKKIVWENSKTDYRGIDKSVREAFIQESCKAVGGYLAHHLKGTNGGSQSQP